MGLMSTTSTERMRRLRERRAEEQAVALLPVPDAVPRDPDELLLPAVDVTLEALKLGEQFAGIAQLARVLAHAIDEASDQATALRVLGPPLFKTLEALGGTPASRARMPQKPQRPAPSKLAKLRAEHMASPAKQKRLRA